MDDLDVFTLPDLEQYNVRPSIFVEKLSLHDITHAVYTGRYKFVILYISVYFLNNPNITQEIWVFCHRDLPYKKN